MRIYMFRSEAKPELRAFAGKESGEELPRHLGPWHVTGVITDDRKPPFRLPRDTIEDAIASHGFQLWRMKETEVSSA
jgi:hypothetical protein